MKTEKLIEKYIDPTCAVEALSLCKELEESLERKREEAHKYYVLISKIHSLCIEKEISLGDLTPEIKEILGIFAK